ncbi:hypothetical protein CHU98_g6687 [Xylaria longipes]|nr:hypothetical protein CHU98_g6687 [Xylaria longipes]
MQHRTAVARRLGVSDRAKGCVCIARKNAPNLNHHLLPAPHLVHDCPTSHELPAIAHPAIPQRDAWPRVSFDRRDTRSSAGPWLRQRDDSSRAQAARQAPTCTKHLSRQ